MGCGGYSKISKTDVNGSVYKKVLKEEISVEIGEKCGIQDGGPTIIFVYGGPGSKKGRLVSELVEVFDFVFINVEKIMLEKVGQGGGDAAIADDAPARKESVQELRKMLEEDPSSVSLSWILKEITLQVDKNPNGRFLVDMMPNLKYLIRTATFSKDCSTAMQQFEKKYPISFALYFTLNWGNRNKSQTSEEVDVKEDAEEERAGFQSDEADLSRTKKRQSMFESSVKWLLDYFLSSERLMTVDVSCRDPDAIASRTCQTMSNLSLENLKLVNTVLIFVFEPCSLEPSVLADEAMEVIKLGPHSQPLTLHALDDAIKSFVHQLNHKEQKTFVVDMSSSCITKDTDAESCKSAITFVNETTTDLQTFDLPGFKGHYKAVSSLENAVCIFPIDTNPSLCKKIAVSFNNEFSTPREKLL